MLEAGLVEMRWYGGMGLLGLHFFRGRCSFVLLLIVLTLASEIIRPFVFMRRAELKARELAATRHQGKENSPTY